MNPSTHFDDLPQEKQDQFFKLVEKLKVRESDIVSEINTAQAPAGKFVASGDARKSHTRMAINVVEHVQHLKSLIGIPDSVFQKGLMGDRHVIYPRQIEANRVHRLCGIKDACELANELDAVEKSTLSHAMNAYINGFSAKVDPRMVELVNTATFPLTFASAAAKELNVPNGTRHLFDTPMPHGWVYGAINVGPAGSLAFSVATHIECPGIATMQADVH